MPDEPRDELELPRKPDLPAATTSVEVPVVAEISAAPVADTGTVAEAIEPVPVAPVPVAPAEPALPEPSLAKSVRVGEVLTLPDEVVAEVVPPAPTIRLERKHPLAIRWMHWINFPVLFTMIWSGLLIYWNDSDPVRGNAHHVYRIGIGSFTLFRFFPDSFWTAIGALYKVTTGLAYHFFFMWFFAINGVVYVLYLAISKEWKFMVPDRKSIVEAIQVTLVDLHLRKGLPPQKKYNGAQKIAYTSVILMGAGSLATGLAIYKPAQLHLLTTLLGGYEMARWEHFMLTLGFSAFFLVHVGQVVLAGWNNFRSMVSGYEIKRVDEPSLEAERRTW